MQFSYNSDYPGLTAANSSTPSYNQSSTFRDPEQFPPAEPIPCARITTRVFHPTRNQVATVQNVLIRTMNCATAKRRTNNNTNYNNNSNNSGKILDDDSLSSFMSSSSSSSSDEGSMNLDADSDSRYPMVQNETDEIKHAYWIQRTIREAIYGRVLFAVILKRRPRSLVLMDGAEWEVTPDYCAVKEMSWQHIRRERGRLAEDPIKEVSAMQHMSRWWKQLQHYKNQQQQQQQQQFQKTQFRGHQQLITTPLQAPQAIDNHHADVTKSLLAMRDTNIMMPLDLLSDERNLYSIMPYCDGGELFERLDLNDRFSEDEARYWMDQVLNGLENLQKVGICHRDMSLENILVHKDGALVIDMGMCLLIPYCDEDHASLTVSFDNMKMDGGQTAQQQQQQQNLSRSPITGRRRRRSLIKPQGTCGKWIYMSPEIYRNEEPFDGFAVDMWAAGVILFLMLTGFPPWEQACRSDERFHYMSGGYLVQMLTEWETGLSSDAMDLLQRMLFLDPKDRLSLEQVRAHPWMVNGRREHPLGLQQNR